LNEHYYLFKQVLGLALIIGRVNFGGMIEKKKLIWLLSALERIVAKLREDVDTLKQHKMTTIAEDTKSKKTNPKKGTNNKKANPKRALRPRIRIKKMRVSLRDIIFNSESAGFIIRMIIYFVRIIIKAIIEVIIEVII